uniref:Uncharacterized protein n=1 Tax=Anopheles atroparvus TaxID=41427 RepID=A0A182IQ92_ANOAO
MVPAKGFLLTLLVLVASSSFHGHHQVKGEKYEDEDDYYDSRGLCFLRFPLRLATPTPQAVKEFTKVTEARKICTAAPVWFERFSSLAGGDSGPPAVLCIDWVEVEGIVECALPRNDDVLIAKRLAG